MTTASARITLVEGRGLPLRGDDIDTDRIIPARFLRAVSFDGLEQHLFADDRRATAHPFDDPAYAGASILLVNRNFGCGSSREHAPQALVRSGVRGIVGESYSEIFFGNAQTLGLPCVSVTPEAIDALMSLVETSPSTVLRIDLTAMTVTASGSAHSATMPASARDALVSGLWDATGLLLEDFDRVRSTADRLPYLTGRW